MRIYQHITGTDSPAGRANFVLSVAGFFLQLIAFVVRHNHMRRTADKQAGSVLAAPRTQIADFLEKLFRVKHHAIAYDASLSQDTACLMEEDGKHTSRRQHRMYVLHLRLPDNGQIYLF